MNIPIPVGLIAIFVSLCLFYYFNQKSRIRRAERRDSLREKHQAFLDSLLKNTNKPDTANEEDSKP